MVNQLRKARRPARSPQVKPMDIDTDLPVPTIRRLTSALFSEESVNKHMPTRARDTPPLESLDPIRGAVDELREQRMSMVANVSQYTFCYEAVLEQTLKDIQAEGHL